MTVDQTFREDRPQHAASTSAALESEEGGAVSRSRAGPSIAPGPRIATEPIRRSRGCRRRGPQPRGQRGRASNPGL
jgi:hypothetical protein